MSKLLAFNPIIMFTKDSVFPKTGFNHPWEAVISLRASLQVKLFLPFQTESTHLFLPILKASSTQQLSKRKTEKKTYCVMKIFGKYYENTFFKHLSFLRNKVKCMNWVFFVCFMTNKMIHCYNEVFQPYPHSTSVNVQLKK